MYGIWTLVPNGTPCGSPVFVTEMSTFEGSGYPDPLTGRTMYGLKLEEKGSEDERYWVGISPSGSFLKIFND